MGFRHSERLRPKARLLLGSFGLSLSRSALAEGLGSEPDRGGPVSVVLGVEDAGSDFEDVGGGADESDLGVGLFGAGLDGPVLVVTFVVRFVGRGQESVVRVVALLTDTRGAGNVGDGNGGDFEDFSVGARDTLRARLLTSRGRVGRSSRGGGLGAGGSRGRRHFVLPVGWVG